MYRPYDICIGRKYRKLPQLNRPLVIIFNTFLCDYHFTEKQKISFLQQIFRLFYKDSSGFRVDAFFKNSIKCDIREGDFIRIICHSTKSVLRKLLLKLNYEIDDYKYLKRRKYTLIFTIYISGVTNHKKITLDLNTQYYDTFHFFMTTDLYYSKDFIQLLFYYYNEEYKE